MDRKSLTAKFMALSQKSGILLLSDHFPEINRCVLVNMCTTKLPQEYNTLICMFCNLCRKGKIEKFLP